MSFLSQCTSGGCGAKIAAGDLSALLAALPVKQDANLLVGYNTSDDAAVYRMDERRSIVSTVDFFPPMVDDPFLFGKIAAANALSDVYAMGGTPLFALNLLCFPQHGDPAANKAQLQAILAGGAEKALEAGTVIAGGHSIYDHEPKYGLAVTGIVDTEKVLRNTGCRPGNVLILTKALGVGLIMSANREALEGRAGPVPAAYYAAATASMERLNRYAAAAVIRAGSAIHACTDVTGFGLAVHAAEMAGSEIAGAGATIVIDTKKLNILGGALDYAKESRFVTGGGGRNRAHMQGKADVSALLPAMQEIVFDPQTSGGLLLAVDAKEAPRLLASILETDPAARIIGEVLPRKDSF
jgi:selenide,water dikinase